MNEFITLFVLAVGLSMDAFAVAVCKGLAMKKMSWKNAVIVGLWFGTFQALMPVIGYFLGVSFADRIKSVDHWIAFVLLALIGGNMIREAFGKEEERASADLDVKTMFIMAVATSILAPSKIRINPPINSAFDLYFTPNRLPTLTPSIESIKVVTPISETARGIF